MTETPDRLQLSPSNDTLFISVTASHWPFCSPASFLRCTFDVACPDCDHAQAEAPVITHHNGSVTHVATVDTDDTFVAVSVQSLAHLDNHARHVPVESAVSSVNAIISVTYPYYERSLVSSLIRFEMTPHDPLPPPPDEDGPHQPPKSPKLMPEYLMVIVIVRATAWRWVVRSFSSAHFIGWFAFALSLQLGSFVALGGGLYIMGSLLYNFHARRLREDQERRANRPLPSSWSDCSQCSDMNSATGALAFACIAFIHCDVVCGVADMLSRSSSNNSEGLPPPPPHVPLAVRFEAYLAARDAKLAAERSPPAPAEVLSAAEPV